MGCSSSRLYDNHHEPYRAWSQPPAPGVYHQPEFSITFPLHYPPTCNKQNPSNSLLCQAQTLLFFTSAHNENGNFNRPYYACPNHFDRQGRRREEWKCWDDYIGLDPTNPRCFCDLPSRQSRKSKKTWEGAYNPWHGYGFWSCAIGHCSFYSDDRYARRLSAGDPACQVFMPWLL